MHVLSRMHKLATYTGGGVSTEGRHTLVRQGHREGNREKESEKKEATQSQKQGNTSYANGHGKLKPWLCNAICGFQYFYISSAIGLEIKLNSRVFFGQEVSAKLPQGR